MPHQLGRPPGSQKAALLQAPNGSLQDSPDAEFSQFPGPGTEGRPGSAPYRIGVFVKHHQMSDTVKRREHEVKLLYQTARAQPACAHSSGGGTMCAQLLTHTPHPTSRSGNETQAH